MSCSACSEYVSVLHTSLLSFKHILSMAFPFMSSVDYSCFFNTTLPLVHLPSKTARQDQSDHSAVELDRTSSMGSSLQQMHPESQPTGTMGWKSFFLLDMCSCFSSRKRKQALLMPVVPATAHMGMSSMEQPSPGTEAFSREASPPPYSPIDHSNNTLSTSNTLSITASRATTATTVAASERSNISSSVTPLTRTKCHQTQPQTLHHQIQPQARLRVQQQSGSRSQIDSRDDTSDDDGGVGTYHEQEQNQHSWVTGESQMFRYYVM